MLDSTDKLQATATGVYDSKVFFRDSAGEGVSPRQMHAHNALAAQRKNPADVVYLLYALITSQMWILVSRFADQNAQLTIVSNTHVCVFMPTTCACVCRNVSVS